MGFILKGNLAGELCKDCKEPLFGSIVRFYRVENFDLSIITNVAADPKNTLQILDEKQIKAKAKLLIAEAEIDEQGNYKTELKGKYEQYDGPLMIDVVTKRVFNQKSKDRDPIQFNITTLQPRWRQINDDIVFYWKYCINQRFWCRMRELFDAWVICGRLLNCNNDQIPLPGVKVIAMDDDWFQDDELGSAITDSTGHFRIDYTSNDFKQTFLSPLINVETPFPPFNSGPDVYFELEFDGTPIVFEKPSDKRNNVGPCLCVTLCFEGEIIIPEISIPATFTHFGKAKYIHIQDDIDSITGKTNPGDFAFYSTINLVGSLSKKLNGQPMEYMFEYQIVSSPSSPLTGTWTPVNSNAVPTTMIGNFLIETFNPINPWIKDPVYINHPDPLSNNVDIVDNWIRVPQQANFETHQDAEILKLATTQIFSTIFLDMSAPPSSIGTKTTPPLPITPPAPPMTAAPLVPQVFNKYVAVRMKQRQVNNSTSEAVAGTSKPIAVFNVRYNNVNKHGSWAPDTEDNQIAAVSVNIQEIITVGETPDECVKIIDALHVNYHGRNENLGSLALKITGPNKPGQSFSFPPISLMASPETFGTTQLQFTPSTQTVNDLRSCAFTIELTASVLLTNGESGPGPIRDFISFCKA
ncbi:hypothetical protein [Aquimarina algiphila]|uniref:hypothetical protein n=1 Tax=Aquimarina algiphila TaxID=2047982 RepID=UPI00232CE69E|nr:hypothetical protein [Aquimarina algiphila]